jgi:hypothetical protein
MKHQDQHNKSVKRGLEDEANKESHTADGSEPGTPMEKNTVVLLG